MSARQPTEALRIEGDLTIFEVGKLHAYLTEASRKRPVFDLDLGSVAEVDTAGIQLLEALRRDLASSDRRLRLVAASGAVRDALRLSGLDRTIELPAPEGEQ